MTIIPNQFFGLGDIIWEQTLVRRIANGNPILWPVMPQFVEGLNRAYPDITFVNYLSMPLNYERKDQYEVTLPEIGDCTVLPLRWADNILKVPYSDCMKSKYMLYGMDWREWKEQAMWKRNEDHERTLCQTLDTYPLNPDYTLVNTTFGSNSQLKVEIPVRGIHMTTMPELFGRQISLFDWGAAIEQVGAIHTVSTSIIYLLEQLDIEAKEVHLYPRKPHETDFRNIEYILQKHKYVLHV